MCNDYIYVGKIKIFKEAQLRIYLKILSETTKIN